MFPPDKPPSWKGAPRLDVAAMDGAPPKNPEDELLAEQARKQAKIIVQQRLKQEAKV